MKKYLLFGHMAAFLVCFSIAINAQTNQHLTGGESTAAVALPAGDCVYRWVNNSPEIGLAAAGTGNIASFKATNTSNSPIIATITATPASSDFAYIANYGSNDVSVVSTLTNTVIATIPVNVKPFGVSVNPDATLVYVTNNGSNNVSVISTSTNAVIGTIPVGQGPKGVVFSTDGSHAYVTNSDDNTVSVIDVATRLVKSVIPVGHKPWGLTITPDGTKVYVANFDDRTVTVINTASASVKATVDASFNPISVAITPDGKTAYVADIGTRGLTTINVADDTPIQTTLPGVGVTSMAFSPDGKRLYCGNFDGYFFVKDIATNSGLSYANGGQCYSVSMTPDASYLYMVDYSNNAVNYVNLANVNNTAGRVQVGVNPYSIGNFIARGKGCNNQPVTFTITVDPEPVITASSVNGNIIGCAGYSSSSPNVMHFTVSSRALSGNITATAPPGFEISTAEYSGYQHSIFLSSIGSTSVFVRSAASATAGNIKGYVVLSASGAADQHIPVKAAINTLPTVNMIGSQTVVTGTVTAAVNFTGTGNSFTWTNDSPQIGLPASGTGNIASFTAVNKTANPIKATVTVTPLPIPAYAYITNINDNTVSVISLATNAIVATIPVGIQPTGVAVSPDGKRVYITNQSLIGPINPSTVSVIDAASNKVISNITVGYHPYGIVISPDGSRAYVTNQSPSNTISVINTATNTVIQTLPTGGENPQSLAISPDGSKLYVTNNSNAQLTVYSTATNAVIGSVQAGAWPLGIAVSPDNSKIYIANSSGNSISVIDAATTSTLYEIPVGPESTGLTLSPDGSLIYVSNSRDGTVSVIDNNTRATTAIIPVGTYPRGVSLNADGTRLYVSNQLSNNVSVINTANNSIVSTINVGAAPYSFGSFVTQTSTCTGATSIFNITVNPGPVITGTTPLTGVNTSYGTPSSSVGLNVSGSNLLGSITVTAPAGFEVSIDNKNFGPTAAAGKAGNTNNVLVYIRLTATSNTGSYSGNITLTANGATPINLLMPNSTVTPTSLEIVPNDVDKLYGASLTIDASSTAFTIGKDDLKNGNTITSLSLTYGNGGYPTALPGKYPTIVATINGSGNGFLANNYSIFFMPGNINVIPAPLTIIANDVNKPFGTTLRPTNVSIAFTATGLQNNQIIEGVSLSYGSGSAATDPVGNYPGSINPSSAFGNTFIPNGYIITYKTGAITVLPPITIIANGVLSPLNTIYGTPSASTSFSVSGNGLPAGILITPPPGFEVSTNTSSFYPTVIVGSAGDIAAATVYVRIKATTPVATYGGNIVLSSGAVTANLAMPNSTVIPTQLTITADNKLKVAGSINPVLTVSYSGFVNNETAAQLNSLPVTRTTAVTTSAAGEYPITASGAASLNYTITYIPGILTISVLPPAVIVPNAFSPNGDGNNDVWNIPALTYYANNVVSVYNRYGQQVYHSVGYAKPWDGTYNGVSLPAAVYYYIIRLDKNTAAMSGPVTVIR